MGKLHELLAVEADLDGTQKKILSEATTTFTKRADHFIAQQKKLEMFDANKKQEETEEFKEMVTTVFDKLDYVQEHVVRYFDAVLQKEATNQIARADLIVERLTLAKDLPATFLLGMETRLKNLRDMYEAIPTLQPGIAWKEDTTLGKGVYRTEHDVINLKTAKTILHKILVPPTDKHPAQIDKWEEQVPVGKYIITTQCSMLSPAKKSQLLGRVDRLIQACKQARQRANGAEIIPLEIGKKLFDYVNS